MYIAFPDEFRATTPFVACAKGGASDVVGRLTGDCDRDAKL